MNAPSQALRSTAVRVRVAAGLLLAALIAFAAGGGASAQARAGTGFTAEQTSAIDAIVAEEMTEGRVPGVNLAVYSPGRSYEQSYGVSDLATNTPADPADTVRIASISKTFTAVAVLRLVDRGRLKLNYRLNRYVKGVDNGAKITIRQLLGMTGGIYDFTRDDQFNAAFSSDPLYPGWQPRDVLEILARHDPDFAPGERVSYSDSNYLLLGLVIERITGRPVREVVNRLTMQAGLENTVFPELPELRSPFAHGYYGGDDDDQPLADYTLLNPNVPWTAGNMTSDVADLKEWATVLGTGELLSERMFERQTHFRPIPNPGGPSIGYGLGLFKLDDWIGHNGAIYGFNTVMFYLPSEQATIVISGNKSTNFSSETLGMFFRIAEAIYPESVSL